MKAEIVLPGGLTRKEFKERLEKKVVLNDLFVVCQPTAVQHVAEDLMHLGIPSKNFFEVGMDAFGDGEKRFREKRDGGGTSNEEGDKMGKKRR